MKNKTRLIIFASLFIFSIWLPLCLYAQEVGPNGELIHSYAINLPSGTNDVAPNIGLVYSSNAGNGMLGLGWSLSGIPVISRDSSYGIEFDNSDHYIFDGQKLVYADPANGGDGYYHTERENFIRIQAEGPQDNVSHWIVTLKNGTKLYFGYQASEHSTSTDGRIEAVGKSGQALLWSLSKVEDVHGNYYIIEYEEDLNNGDYYPRKITYTKNASHPLSAYRTVEFSYETRTDCSRVYIPTLMKVDKRLKWISVFIGGNLLRKYRLDYEYSSPTGKSRLIAIQEYGSDGNWPTTFIVDTIYVATGSVLPMQSFEWPNVSTGTFTSAIPSNDHYDEDYKYYDRQLADVNGDGMADIVRQYTRGGTHTRVFLSNGDGTFTGPIASNNSYDEDWNSYDRQLADVNGDGMVDKVRQFTGGGTHTRVFLANGDGTFTGPIASNDSYDDDWNYYDRQLADVNGDGMADIVRQYTRGGTHTRVFLAKGDGTFTGPIASNDSYDDDWNYYDRQLADVNGDGMADIVRQYIRGGTHTRVFLAKGDGTFTGAIASNDSSNDVWKQYDRQLADVNGDGMADKVRQFTGGGTHTRVFLAKGDGTFTGPIASNDSYNDTWDYYDRQLADVNGDGMADKVRQYTGGGTHTRVFLRNQNLERIHSIFSENSINANITYLSAPKVIGAIIPAYNSYPLIANKSPRPLVTKIEVNPGTGPVMSCTYEYSDGKIYMGKPYDRANLGFISVKKKDEGSGQYTITYYLHDDKDLHGLAYKQENYGSDGHLYTLTTITYEKVVLIDNSSDPELLDVISISKKKDVSENINGEEGTTPLYFMKEYEYDEYGNPVRVTDYGEVEKVGEDFTDVYYDKVETLIEYIVNETNWVIKPERKEVYAYTLSDSWERASAEYYKYDYEESYGEIDKGMLTRAEQVVSENGGGEELVTYRYFYDDYGNLIQTYDPRRNNNEYTQATSIINYDNIYKTYVISTQNAKGQISNMIYNNLMWSLQSIDINGMVWKSDYDVFGRTTTTIAPGDDNTNPTTRTIYSPNGEFPCWIRSDKKESGSNYFIKIIYFDGLGRKMQEKSETVGGWITVDHYYDASGREYKTSLPYLSGNSAYTTPAGTQFTEVFFDPIGHILETKKPDGQSYKEEYQKRGTTSIDEVGHVVSMEVFGTDTIQKSYTYVFPYHAEYSTTRIIKRANGKLIIDNDDNEIRTQLDMSGRKLLYEDPDMGIWTYDYDADGNMISQTDAKNQTIVMEYDQLNRLVKKTLPDSSTENYFYDEDGHGYAKGLVTRVVYSQGAESYSYDERGRIIYKIQTISGLNRGISFTYDSMDRVVTETYPDGEVVTYAYGQNGNLNSVNGTSTYVTNVDYSVMGKVTHINYGNGLSTTYDYYDQANEYDGTSGTYFSHNLRSIQLNNGSYNILDIHYEYDKVSNVRIKNVVFRRSPGVEQPINENYTYDDLNRLITAGSDMYGFKSYAYDEINNIIVKDGYTYQYNSNKPHAVSNDGQFSYTYDANGNMTTRSDGRTLTWDSDNRLISILESNRNHIFTYNTGGIRLKKQVFTGTNEKTIFYFFASYEEEYENSTFTNTIKYYFANGQRIAERSTQNGLRYYHQDHLGSSLVITRSDQSVDVCIHYMPYGSIAYFEGVSDVKYKFTGKEMDDNGLYYYGARYYDPVLGRFISADIYLDGLNRYTYCKNNPLIYSDPTGYWTIGIGIVFGWDEDNGWHIGFGAACDFTQEIGIGVNASYTWNENGSQTLTFMAGLNLVIAELGVGYSYNTHSGHFFNAYGSFAPGIGVGFSTSHYWDNKGKYLAGSTDLLAMIGLPFYHAGAGYRIGHGCSSGGFIEFAFVENNAKVMLGSGDWQFHVLGTNFDCIDNKWEFGGYHGDIVKIGYNSEYGGEMYIQSNTIERVGKAWASPCTAIGVVGGTALVIADLLVNSKGEITYEYNAVNFITSFNLGGAVTLGNTVIYAGIAGPNTLVPKYDKTQFVEWQWVICGYHEQAHTLQYYLLGPLFFIPYLAQGGAVPSNPMERVADEYAQVHGKFKFF